MPDVEHSTLTTTELHEPKGAAGASAGDVYVADGAGSGNWYPSKFHFGGFISFDSATPAYSHSVTTSDTVIDPTFVATHSTGFSSTDTPNARMTYTAAPATHVFLTFSISFRQSSGADRDIEFVVYKNGGAEEGSRIIRTASTAAWGSASMLWDEVLATGDYIEVFVKGSASATLLVASASLTIVGTVE